MEQTIGKEKIVGYLAVDPATGDVFYTYMKEEKSLFKTKKVEVEVKMGNIKDIQAGLEKAMQSGSDTGYSFAVLEGGDLWAFGRDNKKLELFGKLPFGARVYSKEIPDENNWGEKLIVHAGPIGTSFKK